MMNWKKIGTLGLFFVFFAFSFVAEAACPESQQKPGGKNRMAEFFEQKKEYLIRQVEMTKQEQSQFFPLYEQLQKEKFKLHREMRDKMKKIQAQGTDVTDQMYLDVAQSMSDFRLKEAQLDSDYYKKFTRILSPRKLYKFQVAETRFGRDMLKRGHKHDDGQKNAPAK
ncbi:MAG: hypothetical protein RR346_06510 [Bacteroidales bacterium]